jgi:hypothetical protein
MSALPVDPKPAGKADFLDLVFTAGDAHQPEHLALKLNQLVAGVKAGILGDDDSQKLYRRARPRYGAPVLQPQLSPADAATLLAQLDAAQTQLRGLIEAQREATERQEHVAEQLRQAQAATATEAPFVPPGKTLEDEV